jgi:hypothetical protein
MPGEIRLEVGDKRDLSDGTFEIPISSKRTKGFCVVDRSGNVRSLYAP